MVSFRLTTEEYNRFRQMCFANGIKNVSEMARAAIHLLLQQPRPVPEERLESRVSELETRFEMLALEMKRLHSEGDEPVKAAAFEMSGSK